MSELRNEYAEVVDLTIISPEDTKNRRDELENYHLISRGHGLVALTRGGEAVVTLAGHNFGKDEILMAIQQVAER